MMPADPFSDTAILDRYLAGELDRTARAGLEARLADEPALREMLARIRATPRLHAGSPPVSSEEGFQSLMARLDTIADSALVTGRWKPQRIRYVWGMAAVAGIVLGIMLPERFRSWQNDQAETRIYSTGQAERLTVALPGGGRVTLAPHSRVRVGTGEHGAQQIELQGQAFFTVTHDAARPVLVRAGSVQVRVLGTDFDVSHYPDEGASVRVGVVTGKIAVTPSSVSHANDVVLAAGDVADVTDSVTRTSQADPAMIGAWTNGRLVFKETPIPQMLAQLSRWYEYEFRMTDSTLARQHVTTTLVLGRTAETMQALRQLLDVDLKIDGRVVLLVPRSHVTQPAKRAVPVKQSTYSLAKELGK